ncbi:MAG: oppA [Bacteroidota bacterium]|nr:oppA [Bacteroidota bacterium]
MRILNLYFLFAILILSSCGDGDQKAKAHREGKGGIKMGGTFRCNENEYFKSLFPLGITESVGHHVVSQIYEGLVMFNPKDLTVQPALATSWTISEDAKTYTFKIRQGVYFHDDTCFPGGKGREVTAKDFEYCLNLLCTPDVKNNGFSFYTPIIKGGTAHFQGIQHQDKIVSPIGVKAVDDSTLQIELENPAADLLSRLALPFAWVFPKEAVEYYKGDILYHTVGTGPFVLKL